jgi:hypothetical protein
LVIPHSNKADLALLQSAGVQLPARPTATEEKKRPTLKAVALMVRATVRMRTGAEQWAKSRKIHDALVAKVESMRSYTNTNRSTSVERKRTAESAASALPKRRDSAAAAAALVKRRSRRSLSRTAE